jgi:hypothetical protein
MLCYFLAHGLIRKKKKARTMQAEENRGESLLSALALILGQLVLPIAGVSGKKRFTSRLSTAFDGGG